MRQSYRFFSNTLIIWVSQILLLVPQLIMVPFLILKIGEAGYGAYALAWSLMTSIDRFEKSLQSGVVKFCAAHLAEDRVNEVSAFVSSSFVYSVFLAFLVSVSIFGMLKFHNGSSSHVVSALAIIGIFVLLVIPLTPYIAVIQAKQHYYVMALAETISRYLSLAVIMIWFELVEPSVKAVVFIMAVMLLLSRLVQVPLAYHLIPGLQNNMRLFSISTFKMIASFGGVMVLAALCGIANQTGVRWVMATLVSTSFVAHLAIILMPGLLLSQVVSAATTIIMPATSAYEAMGSERMLKELLARSMKYLTMLMLVATIIAFFLIEDVLVLWVGHEYEFLTPYTHIIFISTAFSMTASGAHHMLKGLGKLRITLFNSLLGLVVVPFVFIFTIFLVSRNPYIAVTVGLAAGNIVRGVLEIRFALDALNADFKDLLFQVYVKPLMLAISIYLAVLGLSSCFSIESFIGHVWLSFIAILLYIIGCYAIVVSSAERKELKMLVHFLYSKITNSGFLKNP